MFHRHRSPRSRTGSYRELHTVSTEIGRAWPEPLIGQARNLATCSCRRGGAPSSQFARRRTSLPSEAFHTSQSDMRRLSLRAVVWGGRIVARKERRTTAYEHEAVASLERLDSLAEPSTAITVKVLLSPGKRRTSNSVNFSSTIPSNEPFEYTR